MSNYGQAALRAIELYTAHLAATPRSAWEAATNEIFGPGTSSQRKGCPRGAFLGLCEAGLVKGVPSGQYTRSQKTNDTPSTPSLPSDKIPTWPPTLPVCGTSL